MKIGWNGQIVDEQEAVISVLDHGFLYGVGCFETFRTYQRQPFALDRHLDRMERSCISIGIQWQADRPAMRELITELIDANKLEEAYIRVSVSGGVGQVGLPSGPYQHPNVIVYMKSLPAETKERSLQLLRLRRNTPEGEHRLKSFHYLNNILAKQEMNQYSWAQGAEGLFLDEKGRVAEGIVSNVFFMRGGKLYTPSIETGILPGITRALVMEMVKEELPFISIVEDMFSLEELCCADEIFLTNSIQEIVPVTCIYDLNGVEIWKSQGCRSDTATLQAVYRERTKRGA